MADITSLIQDFDDGEITTDLENTDVEDTTVDEDTDVEDNTSEDADKTKGTDEDKTDAKGKDTKAIVTDDDGFFADDEGDDDTVATDIPAAPSSFSAEDKYIIDNLPLINVRVVMADDTIKTMQVRSAAELPRDMKGIATPYEDKQFDLANAAQENRARELQAYYRQNQTQVQTKEFERKENMAIRADIAELQRDGEIPKFKAQPGTRAFNDDPAAKVVQETIDFMNERNAKYLEKANAGAPYRHIGFADAYELMNGNGKAKVDSKDSAARKDAARKLVSGQGGSSKTASKAPISGRTIKEVAAEFDNFEV